MLAILTDVYVRQSGKLTHTAERQLDAAGVDQRIERVKVARILTEETKRLREELGRRTSKVIGVDADNRSFAVPTVHEWIWSIVPQGAIISADVVGRFLTLERDLHNLRGLPSRIRVAQQNVGIHNLHETAGIESRALREAKHRLEDVRQ